MTVEQVAVNSRCVLAAAARLEARGWQGPDAAAFVEVTYLPDLTPLQAAVVELLELNPEHRARPRLSCHEMRRVDAVLAWADARTAAALSIPAPRLPV